MQHGHLQLEVEEEASGKEPRGAGMAGGENVQEDSGRRWDLASGELADHRGPKKHWLATWAFSCRQWTATERFSGGKGRDQICILKS